MKNSAKKKILGRCHNIFPSFFKKNTFYHSDLYFHVIKFNTFFFKFSDFTVCLEKASHTLNTKLFTYMAKSTIDNYRISEDAEKWAASFFAGGGIH